MQDVLAEARAFLEQMAREAGRPAEGRLTEIEDAVRRTGTYRQTLEELRFGCAVAWRNNSHCIGRFHWRTLRVRDLRHLATADQVFDAIVDHLRQATNGGRIQSMVTVFAPAEPGQDGIRIWNPQLVRYAGYRQSDGSIVGDPLHVGLTDAIMELGWRGPGGPFDVLPIVIQMCGGRPRLFELPPDAVLEVPLTHPDHDWFADLGLRWHALPAISNMRLEIGGVHYTAAPFNGWYMCTEIGGRNLSDVSRYNLLPVIAERMGLNMRSDRTLWKDRALVELNVAVLQSFRERGVTMVDHHSASKQFMQHERNEMAADRIVPAEWSWIVPPVSGSTSPVFHHADLQDVTLKPNFFYQRDPWLPAS